MDNPADNSSKKLETTGVDTWMFSDNLIRKNLLCVLQLLLMRTLL